MSKDNSKIDTRRIKLNAWIFVSDFTNTYGVHIDMPNGTKVTQELEHAIKKKVLWCARRKYKIVGNPITEIVDKAFNYEEKMFYFMIERKRLI